ncbi:NAD-dependent epimerase/dehydratase family protein [Solirubrobacter ginsenosidimutans]|uniref:NAD-dependent epimerase/dehydratase family protein n=1 Tax=Solirubrobacter ginsenosidimutans TaxID=490573 RepID=A0A9X3S374_9ACTN|nr:NAD-dependent epimerase/dehydratase family protein [Solirubrobacter ginsenosidimutans]MDA0163157.1 NAD-dependent epimerase/dehydratase family protein [Solirubrobacter ginsenosidimutans]
MRLLILGGTVFLGRHVVDAALARGHEVTIFTRGRHGTAPHGVEHVIGDRADVTPLQGRAWDAAIDTSGYDPAQVDASSALDIGHYVFVSSCNAYPDWPDKPVDEDSPTWEDGEGYGPDKAAAERFVLARGGAVVRAGLIVGPHDNIFRLPWWVRRVREGGAVPAPGRPDRPLQIIDARDLASWMLDLAELRIAGAFNGTAPIGQTTMEELLRAADPDADLRWIPEDKLEEAGVEPWMEFPLWLPERFEGTWHIGTEKAQAAGLRTRPVGETVADIATWLENGGEAELDEWRSEHRPGKMSPEREAALSRLLC